MKLALIALFLLSIEWLPAQQQKEIFSFNQYKEKVIELPDPIVRASLHGPFNHIQVLDGRAHGSAIGFSNDRYLVIENTLPILEDYLNRSLGLQQPGDTTTQLVIFIKKLWVTQQLELKRKEWYSGMMLIAECFFKEGDNYFPAFRYDTSFVNSRDTLVTLNIIKDAPLLVDISLQGLMNKITSWNNNGAHHQKNAMSFTAINQYYEDQFRHPVMEDSIMRKGVYLSFEEFKNNKPSIAEFSVRKGKETDELYIKDAGGKDIIDRDLWGYCDGKNYYIRADESYFPLVRIGNTFYLNGSKDFTRRYTTNYAPAVIGAGANVISGGLPYYPVRGVTYRIYLFPYQLDMESGKIY